MRTNITRILTLAIAFLLLAGSAAAGAQPATDGEMGGIGGLDGTVDPADLETADSFGEWLEQNGVLLDRGLFDHLLFFNDLKDPFGPADRPVPTGGDDETPDACEEAPGSLECKSATCDALDEELSEAWENQDDMTDEEREAWQATRAWYGANCLHTP